MKKEIDWNGVAPEEIPNNLLLDHPMVQNLSQTIELKQGIAIPYIVKNQILISVGTWHGQEGEYNYNSESLRSLYNSTDWTNKDNKSLYWDHQDSSAKEWLGNVENTRFDGNSIIGDLHVFDMDAAVKMKFGKPHWGISPSIKAITDGGGNVMGGFIRNNAIVDTPAVKTAYINNSEVRLMEDENKGNVQKSPESEEDKKKKKENENPEQKLSEADVKTLTDSVVQELSKKFSSYKEDEKDEKKEEEDKEKEEKEEDMSDKEVMLSEADIITIATEFGVQDLSERGEEIKKWLKDHPGKNVADAMKALKNSGSDDENEGIKMQEHGEAGQKITLRGDSAPSADENNMDVDEGMTKWLQGRFSY